MTYQHNRARRKLKALAILYRANRPLMAWEVQQRGVDVQHSYIGKWLRHWYQEGITDRRTVYNQVCAYWLTEKGKEYAQSLLRESA